MSCGCGTDKKDGKAIVDRVREKGKADTEVITNTNINCNMLIFLEILISSSSIPRSSIPDNT